jgi:putative ABC transport system permease protein
VMRFQSQFLERLRALPGVTHASAITMLPIAATGRNGMVRRSDQLGENEGQPVTEMRQVMDGYFDAMGVRLLAGRFIDQRDGPAAPAVAVVNATLASRLWPNLDPARVVGQQVRTGWERGSATREVVGVVASVRSRRADAVPDPELYAPFRQVPAPSMSYVVRAAGDPAVLTGPVRAMLAQMTPYVALAAVRTFDEVVAASTRMSRLVSWLSVLFGVLAAALAILGIYSVMSYTVAQRERELAIRSAVGASRSALLRLVLKEGLMLSGAGLAAGAAIAFVASGVLRNLLYDVSATDPTVFLTSAAGLGAIALGGYLIPAARASRVEPVVALRSE